MVSEKKKFFEVEIPLLNYRINVLSEKEENLIGRVIKLDMTKFLKGKNVDGTIIIEKEQNKLTGRFVGLLILPSFIRKMIRKNTSYVEDSFKCKENKLTLKTYMLTRKRVHRSVRNALRVETKKFLCDFAEKNDIESIFREIISGRLQKSLSVHLKKIYPLAFCEIRTAKFK